MLLVSVKDIYNEFLSVPPGDVPLEVIVVTIIGLFFTSLIVLITYHFSYQTTVYNRSFAISLPIASMVTALIIITVSANIVLALGMVGALSIIRFRTALKNPFDTIFMFWAVGLGITAGAGMLDVGFVTAILIAIAITLLRWFEIFVDSYFLIIRSEDYKQEEEILAAVKQGYKKYIVRNKTIKDNHLDLTIEIRSRKRNTSFVNQVKEVESVRSIILLSHQGDYISE